MRHTKCDIVGGIPLPVLIRPELCEDQIGSSRIHACGPVD